MGRGILSGLIWGSIISIVVLGTVSLLSPMAEPALPVATGTADTPVADSADAAEPAQETSQAPDADPVDAGVSTEAGMPDTQTASDETAPETDVGSEMTASDGGAPVAQLDTPTAETLPKPAEGPAATAPQTEASGTEVASGVELPAGSEFRKALPETEAAVPGTGAAPEGPIAPAAPAPGNEDIAAASPQTNVPHRPATPGMSVTAPIPPSAEAADAGDVGGAPTEGDTATPVPEPALPSADGGEAAPDAKLTKGFPPPVRTEAVEAASTAQTVAAEAVAAIVDAETALPDVPGAPAVSPVPETGGAPVVASTAPSATGGFAAPRGTTPGDVVTAVTEGETDASADMAVAPADSLTGVQPDTDIVAANEAAAVETAQPVEPAETDAATFETAALAPEASAEIADAPPEVTTAAPRAPTGDPQEAMASETAEPTDAEQAAPVATGDVVVGSAPVNPVVGGFGNRVQPLTERASGGSRLPQIGGGTATEAAQPVTETPTEVAPSPSAPRMDALTRNARPFDNPDGKPLFSVILVDDGENGLDRSVLSTFSFPVTFAIDPTRPDAQEAAAVFTRAGFEVVALITGLPEGATASDVEVTLGSHLADLPQVVAVMDPADGGVGGNRALVEQVIRIAGSEGQGLIGWSRGLDPLEATVRRGGKPVAMVYRALDAEAEKSPVIRRYLDRAAFKASQDGSVVMVGHSRPETVTALFEWARSAKSAQVALAPVSAVLRQK